MKKLAVLFAAIALGPVHAQDATPPEARVPYEEAVSCAAVSLGLGMILSDRNNANSTEETLARGREVMAMLQPFLQHAETVGGKSQEQVIDDIGVAMGALVTQLESKTISVSEFHDMAEACEAKVALL